MIDPPSKGIPNKDLDWLDTWKKMEKVYLANKDKVRAIGVRISASYLYDLPFAYRHLGLLSGLELLRPLPGASPEGGHRHPRRQPDRNPPVCRHFTTLSLLTL